MSFSEVVEHAKSVHGLEIKGVKCRKEMTMHLDCSDSFHSTYRVTVGEGDTALVLINSTSNPRKRNNFIPEGH